MDNIDDFNRGCALILARLYAAFPVPQVLRMADLDECLDVPDDLRAARRQQRIALYGATMQFLADEGYVTFASKAGPGQGEAFSGARLTAKGLAQLSKTPEALRAPGRTLGERLAESAGKIAEQGAADAIKALVAAVFS